MPTKLILAPHPPSNGTVLLVQLAIERPESRCKQLGLCIFDVDFLARFNVVRASDFRLALSKKIVVKMWYCRDLCYNNVHTYSPTLSKFPVMQLPLMQL